MSSTAITNVKIFNGKEIIDAKTIVFENGIITDKSTGDVVIDGTGCTLIPGLFDCHVHLLDKTHYLELAARNGVTTMIDCGTRDTQTVDHLKNVPGLTRILSGYSPAFGPNSILREKMMFPEISRVKDAADAKRYVKERLQFGADYIKIILEFEDGKGGSDFPEEIIQALVEETHKNGKKIYAHTAAVETYDIASKAGMDILTHIPFAPPMPQDIIDRMAEKGLVCVPTLVMMEGIIRSLKKMNPNIPISLEGSLDALSAMREAGVKVLAGTDSNLDDPTTLSNPCFGTALHRELILMTQAGYTPIEVLKSATADPAEYFELHDRGTIETGKIADLVLVQGDPTENIEDIHNIRKVWIGGQPVMV